MPDYKTHADGVFVDTQTGDVRSGKPEEGIQIVAPGGDWTPEVKKDIELHGGDPNEFEPGEEPTEEPEQEPVSEPEPEPAQA